MLVDVVDINDEKDGGFRFYSDHIPRKSDTISVMNPHKEWMVISVDYLINNRKGTNAKLDLVTIRAMEVEHTYRVVK